MRKLMRYWTLSGLILLSALAVCAQEFPDTASASQPKSAWALWNGKPTRSWSEIWNDPKVKWPILIHGASVVWDVETTQEGLEREHGGCVEGNHDYGPRPSRGEMYKIEGIKFAAIAGMSIVIGKAIPKGKLTKVETVASWIPAAMNLYGTGVHTRGAISWYGSCW